MNPDKLTSLFATSFKQASNNLEVSTFSHCIRFVAVSFVILAVMWSVNHFMGAEQKEHEHYLLHLGSRLVRLTIGLILLIIILII